jgi:L-fucose isomerase
MAQEVQHETISNAAEAPRLALITFQDARERMYQKRKDLVDEELGKIRAALADEVTLAVDAEVRFPGTQKEVALQVNRSQADACVLHVPTWVNPNMVITTANQIERPLLLLGNDRPESASLVGWLAAAGGLEEIARPFKRLFGEVASAEAARTLIAFARAASAKRRLHGQTFGSFGVRSLGMYTASHDPNQWQRIFGVDTEVYDQAEIVNLGESLSGESVAAFRSWLLDRVGYVGYDGTTFTPEKLDKQIRSYLATREIVERDRLDFLGVKCQTELSDGYCLQCVSVAFLNDPYDDRGPKRALPTACESDANGALTMQMLHLLSGGKPVTLMDVKFFRDDSVLILANCGSMATSLSTGTSNAEESLKHVHLQPHLFGEAGGAATQFLMTPGPITLARLVRKAGTYHMQIIPGESLPASREDMKGTGWSWPHAFVQTRMDFDHFIEIGASNHLHSVLGDYVPELEELCSLYGIEYEVLG